MIGGSSSLWRNTVAKVRGDKQELVTFHRKAVLALGEIEASSLATGLNSISGQRMTGYTNGLSFSLQLLNHHLVIFLQIVAFNDTDNSIDIVLGRGIATSLDAGSPTLIVRQGKLADILLIAVCHENL